VLKNLAPFCIYMRTGTTKTGWGLVLPLVALYLALTIFPFIYTIVISFFDYNLAKGGTPRFIGVNNYIAIFSTDRLARDSVRFSIIILLIAVPLEIILGTALAFLIRGTKGEHTVRTLLLVPMMVPPVVAGIMWKMLFNFAYGPINYVLSLATLPKISWLGDWFYSQVAVVIMDIWQWTPFVFLITYAGLQGIPIDLVEAARVDGANAWDVCRYVELPMLLPLILVAFLLRLIDALKLFDIVYMTTWGGPGSATHSFSFYIYKVGISYGWDVGYAAALSILLLIVSSVLVNLLIKMLNLNKQLGLGAK
jgi:multiple sugar transport system permease protein